MFEHVRTSSWSSNTFVCIHVPRLIIILTILCLDKRLIQYTTCPLLAFLDGSTPPSELDLGTGNSSATGSSSTTLQPSLDTCNSVEVELPSELLDTGIELRQPARSSLIRLEPLTEEEASEETLFYLCKLSPAGQEASTNQVDRL